MTREALRLVRPGLLMGTLAILYGFALGAFFGVGEHWLRDGQKEAAEAHISVYRSRAVEAADPEAAAREAMAKTLDSSWRYWLRAHFHAGGIGAVAVVLSLLLAALPGPRWLRWLGSLLLGVGAAFYPLFWMLAGMRAPALGSTGAAMESLAWLAVPSAGAAVAGVVVTLYLVVARLFVGTTDGEAD